MIALAAPPEQGAPLGCNTGLMDCCLQTGCNDELCLKASEKQEKLE